MSMMQEQRLSLSPQEAWTALNDVAILQACIPGCKTLSRISAEEFAVEVTIPLGLTDMSFSGRIRLRDVEPAVRYTLQFESTTNENRGEARVVLDPISEKETLLRYSVSIAMGGRLGRWGTPLWESIALKLADDFFRAFGERIHLRPQPT